MVAGDVTTSDDVALVQSDLDAISEWSVANELPISLPKCCALHYGSSNSKHQNVLSGQQINSVSECADLGVLRSDTFSFQPHVRAVALKAARLAWLLRCSPRMIVIFLSSYSVPTSGQLSSIRHPCGRQKT
jgi:hypothetical protein